MKNHKSRMTCIKNSLLAAANLGFTHAVPFLAWGDERGGYANSLSPPLASKVAPFKGSYWEY